jgi:hypothetical protein
LKWKELFLDTGEGGAGERGNPRQPWDGPETFPEYLRLIDPDDRARIAEETERAFLLGEAKNWQATFRRNGLVILARAKAVSPGHVIGVDIDVTGTTASSQ